ncbi:hypothetical protein V2W45_1224636, partial [Cenococcum geophilum]
NPTIISYIHLNYNIFWISIVIKCLYLIYYLINYVIKDNISPHQVLLKAVLLKQSIKKVITTLNLNTIDLRF